MSGHGLSQHPGISADGRLMTVLTLSSFPPAQLVDRLRRCGFFTRVHAEESGQGPDQRLYVHVPGREVRVELLGPVVGLRDAPVWHAVRIADHDRAVWCGPPRTCADGVLCRFVSELIELPVDELLDRWQRLG